jgi:hypothetical protein
MGSNLQINAGINKITDIIAYLCTYLEIIKGTNHLIQSGMNKASLLIIFFILLLCSPVLHAQQDRAKDYILVLHSINFRETWTHQAYEAIRTTLTHDGIPVKGEELQIPLIKDTAEINCKVDYLRQQYPFPPKAVICSSAGLFLITNGKTFRASSATRKAWFPAI